MQEAARDIAELERRLAALETRDVLGGIPWQTISLTSTVTGWSSFTTKQIMYARIGTIVYVVFNLVGTSNSTSTSFTVPLTCGSIGSTNPCRTVDNGGVVTGMAIISASGSTVNCYTSYNAAAWTNSGSKTAAGILFYGL